jgi:hypothetical protein
MNNIDDVYVLGAGASYVHGAPLTDQILPYALAVSPRRTDPRAKLLERFLRDVFHFSAPRRGTGVNAKDVAGPAAKGRLSVAWERVPSLVDVLSVVDVSLDRKESLARGYDIDRLRHVRSAIEFAIFDALEDSLRARPGRNRHRSQATHVLANRIDPDRSAVISFNYDVIADIALAHRHDAAFDFGGADIETLAKGDHSMIDYGVEFANVAPRSTGGGVPLLKLHGSFNWLRSRLTGDLFYGGMQKAAGVLFRTDTERRVASLWQYFGGTPAANARLGSGEELEPVMITPTHLKDLRNAHISRIWRRAEECLQQAKRVTFIGYSLPGDDLHVKYLFKRAQGSRAPGAAPPRVVVVNRHRPGSNSVRANYERFFGRDNVEYHREGFDAWVARLRSPAPRARRRDLM